MIDVDCFNDFNDHYGHQVGDECLRKIAAEVKRGLSRPGDVAARYGGEEFVAVLPDTLPAGALMLANALRSRVEKLAIPHVKSPHGVVTISLGVATCSPQARFSAENLLKSADGALYEAKRAGRNRVRVAREVFGDTGLHRALSTLDRDIPVAPLE